MHALRGVALLGLAFLLFVPARLSFSADPAVAGAGSTVAQAAIMVVAPSGLSTALAAEEVARLPATQVTAPLGSEHGQVSFEGPLLWTLLDHAHAIDPEKHAEQVRQTVEVTGRDGYTAVLALGEMAPGFAGKQVIPAARMDGRPLGPEHFRIVVPGDRRGGRSVRDVVRIAVSAPGPGQQHQ